MKRKLPLQISIFLLLFIFTVAGSSIEGTAYHLRQDLNVASAATHEQTPQNAPIAAVSQDAKETRQVNGEVVAKQGNSVAIKTDNTITNVELPSNAYVMKNGLDATRPDVTKNDYVIATIGENNMIASITSFSRPVVDVIRVLLLLSIIATTYLLSVFVLRFLSSKFSGVNKIGHPYHQTAI